MGADRLFFVEEDPVLVFTALPDNASLHQIVEAYKQAWCLTGPRYLFLATGDEVRVYSLSQPPPKDLSAWVRFEPLRIVTSSVQIVEVLREFQRDQIESGQIFLNAEGAGRGRADATLLRDISAASQRLVETGLDLRTAHGLIERLILVRYLEDRGVITSEYLKEVAGGRKRWNRLLDRDVERPNLGTPSVFLRVLSDIRLTNAVFARLERDFNGDLFALTDHEQVVIQQRHLDVAQRLLSGGTDTEDVLFLWAYDFSVVPTSLISNMYEQFYHDEINPDKATGTHYTPAELVQFALAQTLTPETLRRTPRVIDPACGSGAFLVEAYRYLVRFSASVAARSLTPAELRRILVEQVAGIDTNPEAIRLAAFSLYVAFLNYQTPQDIRLAGPLPRLVWSGASDSPGSLVIVDAFTRSRAKGGDGQGTLVSFERDALPWPDGHFDVVIGNPPWTEPPSKRNPVLERWLSDGGFSVGERNPSQAFMWRSLALLKPDGVGTLLVGATAFLNSRGPSRIFLGSWLDHVRLRILVNFTDVRGVFFSRAVAPFYLVSFTPGKAINSKDTDESPVEYYSARPSSVLDRTHSMAFARLDRRLVIQRSLREKPYIWKVYGWGNHNDAALMTRLDSEQTLADLVPLSHKPGYGYQRGLKAPSAALRGLRSLRTFKPWGVLEDSWFESKPSGVKRDPSDEIYRGQRIVVTQGVKAGFGPLARLATEDFSFRHIIYALPLRGVPPWVAKVVLATLLSSLGRYRLFMLSGSWGVWHDCVYIEDVLRLPIRLPKEGDERVQRLVTAVDQLAEATDEPMEDGLFSLISLERGAGGLRPSAQEVLSRIDDALFDVFELTDGERDLVRDFFAYTLPLNQLRANSSALGPVGPAKLEVGLYEDLDRLGEHPLATYLRVFLGKWSAVLPQGGEFAWVVTAGLDIPAIMVALVPTRRGELPDSVAVDASWRSLMRRFAAAAGEDRGGRVLTEGVVRAVTDTEILVLKRNERRLWSASAAREDAEATMFRVAVAGR
ncbi:N-6 DNA methylase [Phytohabitans flavus]